MGWLNEQEPNKNGYCKQACWLVGGLLFVSTFTDSPNIRAAELERVLLGSVCFVRSLCKVLDTL